MAWDWAIAAALMLTAQAARADKPADCDCPGLAQVPAVRTDLPKNWTSWNKILASEVAAADNSSKAFDIVFYGDSITEQYRGTNMGTPVARAKGTPAVFARHFSQYFTAILASGGDMIDNLYWRLLYGKQTPTLAPRVAVMLIGTNDLGAVDTCFGDSIDLLDAVTGVNHRLKSVISHLRLQWPQTPLVVAGVLPRAGWTMPEDQHAWPNRFTVPIAGINNATQALAALDGYLYFVDCGAPYITEQGINKTLVPDGVHPSHVGMELLAECYAPLISHLVATPSSSGPAYDWPTIDPYDSPCEQEDIDSSASDSSPDSSSGPLMTAVRRAVSMSARSSTLVPPDPTCPLC